jgi:hypothetical protein
VSLVGLPNTGSLSQQNFTRCGAPLKAPDAPFLSVVVAYQAHPTVRLWAITNIVLKAMGTVMKEESTEPIVDLDPNELLGLSQVAKVSGKWEAVGRLLSKVGAEGPPPPPVSPLMSRP